MAFYSQDAFSTQRRFVFLIHLTDKESPVTSDTMASDDFDGVKSYKAVQYLFISKLKRKRCATLEQLFRS